MHPLSPSLNHIHDFRGWGTHKAPATGSVTLIDMSRSWRYSFPLYLQGTISETPTHTGFLKKIFLKESTYRKWHRIYINTKYILLYTLVHLPIIHNNSNNANEMWIAAVMYCLRDNDNRDTSACVQCRMGHCRLVFNSDLWLVQRRCRLHGYQGLSVLGSHGRRKQQPILSDHLAHVYTGRLAQTCTCTHPHTHMHLRNLTTQHIIAHQWH